MVGVAKPDPGIFRIALDALNVPADGSVLHVGDSLRYDVAGAVAAGLQPVHMDPYGLCSAPGGHAHITQPDRARPGPDIDAAFTLSRRCAYPAGTTPPSPPARPLDYGLMRWSTMHIPTLRDDPADADATSHRLLLRAGLIRQLMAGHYSLLPLGQRVRLKIDRRSSARRWTRIGAQEFLTAGACTRPSCGSRAAAGTLMGDEMFRLKDRKGADLVPRHDPRGDLHHARRPSCAVLPRAAADLVPDPDQVPRRAAAQVRPAARPRVHHEGLLQLRPGRRPGSTRPSRAHRDAYVRIFERLSASRPIPVDASSGAMGGSDSIEFMCPCPAPARTSIVRVPGLRLRREHREGHVPAGRRR